MRQFSAAMQTAIDNNRIEHQAFITFADSTTMTVGEDKIWQGGFEIDTACSGQSGFEVGACVIGEFKLVLNNAYGDFDGLSWYGATIRAQFEAWSDDARTVSIGTTTLGEYDVDEVDTNGTLVKLTCLDAMYRFDIPLSEVNPYMHPYPNGYKPYYLLDSCCQAAGVAYGMADQYYFDQLGLGNYLIGPLTKNDTGDITVRDFISMLCTVCGCYAYIHPLWGLIIQRLDTSWMKYTGSDYSTYYVYQELTSANMRSFNRDEENVTITGVIITDKDDVEYSAGTSVYPIKYEKNVIIKSGYEQTFANALYTIYGGAFFRPFKATHLSNLSFEAGDNVLITDQWGNVYKSVILHTKYSADGLQESDCTAAPASEVQGTRYSASAKAISSLANMTQTAASAGTSTSGMLISPKVLADTIAAPRYTTLFTGDETGDVTLSSSAANYSMLEIFFEGYNARSPQSIKVINPNGRTIDLSVTEPNGSGQIRIRIARYTISGTSITLTTAANWNGYMLLTTSGNTWTNGNVIHVTRVDGYV